MLRLLRTLTPGLLALCHLGVAQAAAQTAPPGASAKQTNKAAHSSEEERAAKKKVKRRKYRMPIWLLLLVYTLPQTSLASHKDGVIAPKDYVRWKTIEEPVLSNSGEWVAYTLAPQSGDAELVVRSTKGDAEFRTSLGRVRSVESFSDFLSRPASRIQQRTRISADSSHVVFSIADSVSSNSGPVRQEGTTSSFSLGIMSLPDGRVTKIPQILSFTFPQRSSKYLAYRRGTVLVLRNLLTGGEERIPNVTNYTFDESVTYLAYAVASPSAPEHNGVYARRLQDGRVFTLLNGPGTYSALAFDRLGRQIAFLSDRDSPPSESRRFGLYLSSSPTAAAKQVVEADAVDMSMQIAVDAGVHFTRNGNALRFEIKPTVPNAVLGEDGRQARFDLWRWDAPLLPSSQMRLPTSYPAVYHIRTQRWTQLANASLVQVILSDDAGHAVGFDLRPYMVPRNWGERKADVYLLDTVTGSARLFRRALPTGEEFPRAVRFSPNGNYLLYFENRRWFSYDLARDQITDLTGALLPGTRFDLVHNTRLETRRPALPIGVAGWTANDQRVWLYAEHDVWEIDPSGKVAPQNLTEGRGQRENIQFRVWPHFALTDIIHRSPVNPDLINADDAVLLTAYRRDPASSGVWLMRSASKRQLELLFMQSEKKVELLAHARTASQDYYLLTQQSYSQFPDLWAGPTLNRLRKITNANPHQKGYRWGVAEVVRYNSRWGVPLHGVLYRPQNLDLTKKYPLIVNDFFVLDVAGHLYNYEVPRPNHSASIASPARYVSKGYLVLTPAIEMAAPYTGESAVAAVVPAVESLIDMGLVDRDRIGVTGHSWSGHLVNYLVTHTDLFRCAVSSAGASNSLSAYSGLEGGSPHIYENGPQLHNASIWERPLVYLANSPLLFADRVRTPVLMLHNENDNAVPFAQAIEFFIGLRRNAKEAYLFNYKGESHTLFGSANKLDWDLRQEQFLDHFLMNAPMPEWMSGAAEPGTPQWISYSEVHERQ